MSTLADELPPTVLRALAALAALPTDKRPIAELSLAEARARTRAVWVGFWNAAPPRVETVFDHRVETPAGPVGVRVYDPASDGTRPIVYFHGGGFVVGDLDTHDGIARRLALFSGRPVVSVDYRRAPEHPYPAPLDDCTAVAAAVASGAAGLGIDGARFAVAGDSAGANLALGAALRLRDAGTPPRAGLLFFGNYDPAQARPSHRRYAEGYGLTSADVAWFWKQYLGDALDAPPPDAAALGADLAGLPPLFVTAAECDPIRDDSLALAEALEAAGVPHVFRLWPGMIHGCVGMSRELNEADAQLAEAAVWLAANL